MGFEGLLGLERQEKFNRMFFPESVVKEAIGALASAVRGETRIEWGSLTSRTGSVSWDYDNETEFFTDYGPSLDYGFAQAYIREPLQPPMPPSYLPQLSISIDGNGTSSVTVRAEERSAVLRPFSVFRAWAEKNPPPVLVMPELPSPPPLKIFIGHGRSHDWRDLKDALHDHHGYDVEAFETKPRAGYTIPDVIESMARGNALALLVLTPDDEQIDGSVRARESVVHEVGYFQGRLGNKRAILLMKEGVNEFSNVHGIVHVPYKSIREVTGEVLAIIKREFPHLQK